MTTFRQFTCSVCGSPIEYGEYLPFRHTAGLRPNVRAHYAGPLRVSVGRSDLMASLPGAVDIERPTEPRERLTGTAAGG